MRPPSIPTTIPINRDDSKHIIIMKSLYNSLIEYREPKTHRILIQLFMCLPSRKDFPEYFNTIAKPIAMNKIRDRIERSVYQDEDACMEDFKLMFSNCKFFNEDESQIHQDAVNLETMLLKRREQLQNEYSRPSRESKDAAKGALLNATTINANHSTSSPKTTSNKEDRSNNISNNSNINNNNSTNTNTNTNNNNNNNNNNTNNNINNNHNLTSTNYTTNNATTNITSSPIKHENNNHNHHNETSMDSNSNLSAELIASTPVEKCSLNTRRGRNADAPKRQLLTGYIIYASEIRKQVIDKNPNQNFGDISRLVGNEWKALPHDIRSKYDQRALIHNKRVREKAQRDSPGDSSLTNGLHTPKLTKRKLAKLAKEQMRQHHLSISGHDELSNLSPRINQERSSSMVPQTPNSTHKHLHHQHSQPQINSQLTSSKNTTVESSTQTTAIRFVEPPIKKRLVYSETFRKYIEGLQVPNLDLLVEETVPERTPELPTQWLGAGIGRHESPEAALWALRDFMLQDAVTMRRSMEPYL